VGDGSPVTVAENVIVPPTTVYVVGVVATMLIVGVEHDLVSDVVGGVLVIVNGWPPP